DDLRLAHELCDGEREIGGSDTFLERACEMYAADIWCEEINRLTQHAGLGLDTTDTPTNNADAVDHRAVRVRADERGLAINTVRAEHALGEIFEIHLMYDADAGRDDLEGIERLHAPLKELVTLAVARELQLQVALHRIRAAGKIHLHR